MTEDLAEVVVDVGGTVHAREVADPAS